jgi:DNA-binding NarL/FixJ family response regulator
MLSNAEREKLVLDLYNQGKNIRQIAKEARMSFRDINTVLKKAAANLESENSKKQSDESPSDSYLIRIEKIIILIFKSCNCNLHGSKYSSGSYNKTWN